MHHPKTEDEYDRLKQSTSLAVVQFSANWCGPCRVVKPEIEKLAKEYKDVTFIYVDVDELEDLPNGRDVKGVPTFKIYKDGMLVSYMAGANAQKVREQIEQYK